MSVLKVYSEVDPNSLEVFESFEDIKDDSTQDEVLKSYEVEVYNLMKNKGFLTADVISLNPSVESHPELRKKFLNEHTHSEDEARFFIDGQGLFCIHENSKVYAMLCTKEDLINVPAGTKHWFDMGPNPFFKCIRMFTNKEGWVAQFTGSTIADNFPRLEN